MPGLYVGDDTGEQELPVDDASGTGTSAPAPSVQRQTQVSYKGGSSGSSGSQGSSNPAPAAPPSPLDGLPQYRVAQIQDLVNQWKSLVGFSVSVSDQLEANMANNYTITDIYDVGQYMKANMGSAWSSMSSQPWAWYGMSATEYNSKLSSYRSTWSQLTGTELPANDGNGNIVDQALKQYQGQMSDTQFQQWLMSQDSIKNTYGWLKYGLNFDQFQQQKLGMNLSFGRTLSDTEGVTQLQYLHSATGPSMAIANQPTFTQQERKQANVGISGSVAR